MVGLFKKKNILDDATKRANSIVKEDTSFLITEAYKTARTNMMFSLAEEKNCKIIVFTSSNPGEGKSTTTINMAVTLAQTGEKVLLIDADLRKPKLHVSLQTENKRGLTDILAGFAELSDSVFYSEAYGFNYITAGKIPPNPAELLSSKTMEKVLKELSQNYEYILIDTPPVNVVTDAVALSKLVTGIVFIVKENETTHEEIKRALAKIEFADAKILGFMLTNEKVKVTKYGKYSKYGRYGKYKQYSHDYK